MQTLLIALALMLDCEGLPRLPAPPSRPSVRRRAQGPAAGRVRFHGPDAMLAGLASLFVLVD